MPQLLREITRLARYAGRMITRPRVIRINGLSLHIPSNTSGPVLRSMYSERYETVETRILPDILNKDDRVVEIGSAIGFVGLVCSRLVPTSQMILIEANSDLIGEIRRNFEANATPPPKIILGLATADSDGFSDFHVSDQFWSSSVLDRGNTKKVDKVQNVNLNHVIAEFSPTVLICDIEGGEVELFPNLHCGSIEKLVVEIHHHVVGADAARKLIETIRTSGFSLVQQWHDEVYYFARDGLARNS